MFVVEGIFKGYIIREKSLFLKYFDRFIIFFNVIIYLFKMFYDIDFLVNGIIDIDRIIRSC